jgi:hypothetical protein
MRFAMVTPRPIVAALAIVAAAIAGSSAAIAAAGPAAHNFDITYRDFGSVSSHAAFRSAPDYQVRFEGCFAKKSDEGVCAFTLRSAKPLRLTNAYNLSHGSRADRAPMRTCCLFVQGRNQGYPIITTGDDRGHIAIVQEPIEPGKDLGVMLRLPDYKKGSPLATITFSRGQNDPGVTFPAHVEELP